MGRNLAKRPTISPGVGLGCLSGMLYDAQNAMLLETVAMGFVRSDGSRLNEAGIEALGKLVGSSIAEGPIERVALSFMMEEEARVMLDACKRFGVQCRAFSMSTGNEDILFEGARVKYVSEVPVGPLLPVLREAAWPHVKTTVHRRLFKSIDDGPWLTFAIDQGTTLARLPANELERRSFAELEAEALANLAKRNFTITRSGAAAQLVDEYAPEALLLPSVCAELCRVVGEPLCLVAAREGMLLAASATNQNMIEVADKMFREASGRRLSPMPLTISAEGVQGFAAGIPAGVAPEASSKPWWRFW